MTNHSEQSQTTSRFAHIERKLSPERLQAALDPIQQATGLPNAAYDDAELFEFERDQVIGKTWAALDFTSELPQGAYAKPIDFMGLPVLITRDRKGNIRVFHNVCSHRGMVLMPEAGPVRNLLRCRYHSWSYDLAGDLKSTPHIGGVGENTAPGFSCEGKGLKEIRSGQWMGIIFINLSGDAESLEEFIAPLETRWEQFTGTGAFNALQVAETHSNMQLEVKANWKLAIENYCEAYHLPWVHPDLNSYSPLDRHINLHVNDYMSGQASLNYTFSEVSGLSLPKFSAWPSDRLTEGEYISLYPNVLLGVQVDHVFAIILQPVANNFTLEKLQISYVNEEATGEAMADCRKAVMAAWKLVFEEDIFAVESMQLGRKSPGFEGGHFSPVLDAPTHDFHKWVAKRYQEALSPSVS
ncbi:MAG: aromatic ring-hydroxylating dioxygenase subunit alpha [Pseudomonadota bacterium]